MPTVNAPIDRIDITCMTRAELAHWLASQGERPFRAKQLWSWLHQRHVPLFANMTDLSLPFRHHLQTICLPLRPTIVEHRIANDGTQKWLLALSDQQTIETVFIPEEERGTVCISTQVGCTLRCPFCQTGQQPFSRNLTTGEIVQQLLLARSEMASCNQKVTNIVLMGMGEPLYNYDAVSKAVHIFLDETGIAIGTRKITLSTAGVVPFLNRVGHELGINLAISLHAVRDEVRNQLVPLNRKYNLAQLRLAVQQFPLKETRRITWEYILLDGINDSLQDADDLADYVAGIPSKINLLTFNPWPGSPYLPSPQQQVSRFQDRLLQKGLTTILRASRGHDIAAACGQLKSRSQTLPSP